MGTLSDHGLTEGSTPSDHGIDPADFGGGGSTVTGTLPISVVAGVVSIPTSLWEKGWGEVLSPADWLTAIHLGGLFEEDVDGNLIPKASPDSSLDTFWEVDGADNLVPRVA